MFTPRFGQRPAEFPGQDIKFRVEGEHAYLPLENGKESKYRVASVEQKPAKAKE